MLIIKVWGLPLNQSEEILKHLHQIIIKAVSRISELDFSDQNDMVCLFPPDLMRDGLGEEIIIEISGLLKKPERTAEVRQRLAASVGSAVNALYPKAKVESSVSTMNPLQGFWTSEKPVPCNSCIRHGVRCESCSCSHP